MSGKIPVVDLFAGPGGLGEGFSAFRTGSGWKIFTVRLSIEMESSAYQSLRLRHFARQFPDGKIPEEYYRYLRDDALSLSQRIDNLFLQYPKAAETAKEQALLMKLEKNNASVVRDKISTALGGASSWVLLGGPPCQAYSVIGRWQTSDKRGYSAAGDERQHLYKEYLQVLADHRPAVFIMENVKGLLSARMDKEKILDKIIVDLKSPTCAMWREERKVKDSKICRYRIYSLTSPGIFNDGDSPANFVVKMENYGIPQARHRVIIIGVRDDIKGEPDILQPCGKVITAKEVLEDLPRVRSGISGRKDNPEEWRKEIKHATDARWFLEFAKTSGAIRKLAENVALPRCGRGSEFVSGNRIDVGFEHEWFIDPKIGGAFNHCARTHMATDLHRYFFAACFAKVNHRSPTLADFPEELLPEHKSAVSASEKGGNFADRFRVQLSSRPATTVLSHISRDGHYYIHPDPTQCRSLTVREAARLQTFPDNYFFCGSRTAQYVQVGNAVPPLLAKQIAEIVYNLLRKHRNG